MTDVGRSDVGRSDAGMSVTRPTNGITTGIAIAMTEPTDRPA